MLIILENCKNGGQLAIDIIAAEILLHEHDKPRLLYRLSQVRSLVRLDIEILPMLDVGIDTVSWHVGE